MRAAPQFLTILLTPYSESVKDMHNQSRLSCPECEEPIPAKPDSYAYSVGPEVADANMQFADCPRCKVKLQRSNRTPNEPWILIVQQD